MKKEIKKLEKKADKLWSLAIRARDKKCLICEKKDIQAHHFVVRRARSKHARWDINNGISLCYYHHIHWLHGGQWSKPEMELFIKKTNNIISEEKQKAVLEKSKIIFKPSIDEMKKIIYNLEELIKLFDKGEKNGNVNS